MSSRLTTTRSALACAVAALTIVSATSILAQAPSGAKQPEAVYRPPASPALTPAFPLPQPSDLKHTSTSFPQPSGPFDIVENGFRRVHRTETITLTAEQVAEHLADGKGDMLRGNTLTVNTFTDYLPANWLSSADVPAGARVDSYGNPIVNDAYALPGWAQQDVDGLRQAIGDWLLHLDNLELALAGQADQITAIPPRDTPDTYLRSAHHLQMDRQESQMILGNYLAQSFTRGIDVSDLMPLDHARMTAEVVNSMAQYFHFYEALKAQHARRLSEDWPRGVYPAPVVALLTAHSHLMSEILSPEDPDEGGIAGAGDCNNRDATTAGWTATFNGIGIWHGVNAPADDEWADIPIGHLCYYQPCEDGNPNLNVRVSSNGYIGFYEQGAGETPGWIYNNTPLPTTLDPDGIAAAWWDDLHVTNQGIVDEVVYKIEGAVNQRVLTVEYWSVSRYQGSVNEAYYFQVKLFEASLQVQFHYGPSTLEVPSFDNRTVGIENYSGTGATCGPNCTNTISGAQTHNYSFAFPQTFNDECTDATCLLEGSVDGENFGASGTDITVGCAVNDFADVWYRYRAPASGNVTVSTCSLPWFDTTLAIFTSCGGAMIACNDDGCSFQSTITFAATAGSTYLIRVAGFAGQRGLFTLTLDAAAPLTAGDLCESALPIAIPGTGAGNYTTVNNTGCTSLCVGSVDEWLAFTAPASGVIRASTCVGDTNFDTTLVAYTGPCAALTQVACNDDAEPFCNGVLTSRINWVADAGTLYYIRVAGFAGSVGNYDLALSFSTCPADIAPLDAGDGVVNTDDLVAVILGWGPCNGCRADFVPAGGNNQVNADDLVAVILAWGTCP